METYKINIPTTSEIETTRPFRKIQQELVQYNPVSGHVIIEETVSLSRSSNQS